METQQKGKVPKQTCERPNPVEMNSQLAVPKTNLQRNRAGKHTWQGKPKNCQGNQPDGNKIQMTRFQNKPVRDQTWWKHNQNGKVPKQTCEGTQPGGNKIKMARFQNKPVREPNLVETKSKWQGSKTNLWGNPTWWKQNQNGKVPKQTCERPNLVETKTKWQGFKTICEFLTGFIKSMNIQCIDLVFYWCSYSFIYLCFIAKKAYLYYML